MIDAFAGLALASFAFATPTLPTMMAEQGRMLSFHFSLAGSVEPEQISIRRRLTVDVVRLLVH